MATQKRKTSPVTWMVLLILIVVLAGSLFYFQGEANRNYRAASTAIHQQAETIAATLSR